MAEEGIKDFDYIIATDLGTTSTAYAIRKPGDQRIVAVSPITNEITPQKTSSEIHFFLENQDDPLTVENSQLGSPIQPRFQDPKYQYHLHFAFYKMELYHYKTKIVDGKEEECQELGFRNETKYPKLPICHPLNDTLNRQFLLSDVYTIVVQHVKNSIQKYFANNNMKFNANRIMFIVTVPAVAQEAQKFFMREIFKQGLGKFNGQYIPDERLQIVLEPEGGFRYALFTKKDQIQGQTLNIAVMDFGGGTYDLTVAKFEENKDPVIAITNFGAVAGGSDVDRLFMREIDKITKFSKVPKDQLSDKDRSIILSDIQLGFQKQKEMHLGKEADQDNDHTFQVDIHQILRYVDREQVKDALKDYDQADVLLQDDDLLISNEFARSWFLTDVQDKLVSRTRELIQNAKEKGFQINVGIMLGGFSACDKLMRDLKSQFNLDMIMFGDESSNAIVKGATLYNKFKIKKFIRKSIGVEIATSIDRISPQDQQTLKHPAFKRYIDQMSGKTGATIDPIFQLGDEITKDMEIKGFERHGYRPLTEDQKTVSIILHTFCEGKICPTVFAQDENVTKANANPTELSPQDYSFELIIDVPNIPFEQRVLSLKYCFQNSGECLIVYHKWANHDKYYSDHACKRGIRQVPPLYSRFQKYLHVVFCVDRSGSMGSSFTGTVSQECKNAMGNVSSTNVGGVYNAIFTFISERKRVLLDEQENDMYSIIPFDSSVTGSYEKKYMKITNPTDVFSNISDGGGTDFAPPLTEAILLSKLTTNGLKPILIFLTDGDNGDDNLLTSDFCKDVNVAFDGCNNITVIGFGTSAKTSAKKLADRFPANLIQVDNVSQIAAVFAKLSATMIERK